MRPTLLYIVTIFAFGCFWAGCASVPTSGGGTPATQPTTQPAVSTLSELQKIDAEVQAIAATGSAAGIPYMPIALAITTLIGGALTVIQTYGKSTAQTQLAQSNQALQSVATSVVTSLPVNTASTILSHAQTLAPHVTLPVVSVPAVSK